MSQLVFANDQDLRLEDLNLDFYLTATPIQGGFTSQMDGRQTYVIQAFEKGIGFGITSIDIDVKPSLQPVITIVFKDIYGNTVFKKDDNFPFEILFQLPYPKFRLYVKGYLGKSVNFLLQVKSVQSTFIPSDGSYELKAEFVPNVFGFFNDIPYQFLFAVKGLKELYGDAKPGGDNNSIIDIADIGAEITVKVSQVKDKYESLKTQLQSLQAGYTSIGTAWKNKTLKLDSIPGDSDLISKDFKPIQFNINFKDSGGNLLNNFKDADLETIGKIIYLSINSASQLDLNQPIATLTAYLSTKAAKDQEALVKKILSDNSKAAQEISLKQAYNVVEDKKIDTQSIYNVMTRLAGDCAYILGYILEGGIAGFNSEPSRITNDLIFGNYYPLVENTNPNNAVTTLGGQVPYKDAKIELRKVEEFVKSLYTGRQRAQEVIDRNTETGTGSVEDPPPPPPPTPLSSIISLVERFKVGNDAGVGQSGSVTLALGPYYPNADTIIVNMIQRSGLIGAGFAGFGANVVKDDVRTNQVNSSLINSELKNITPLSNELNTKEREKLKKFCSIVVNEMLDSTSGNFRSGKSFDSITSAGLTFKDYLAAYFNKFPKASTEKGQFSKSDPKTLKSTYTYNNGILYHSPRNIIDTLKQKNGTTTKDQTNWTLSDQASPEVVAYYSPFNNTLVEAAENLYNVDELTGKYAGGPFNPSIMDDLIPFTDDVHSGSFAVYKATAFTSNLIARSIFVDFAKMVGPYDDTTGTHTSKYYALNDLFINHSSDVKIGTPPKSNDYIFRLLDGQGYRDQKLYAIDFEDQLTRSSLAYMCYQLLYDKNNSNLGLTDNEIKEKEKALRATGQGGVIEIADPNVPTGPRPYQKDEAELNNIYTQFHHICAAWIALANPETKAFTGIDGLPSGTDDKALNIRTKLERAYKNSGPSDFFYLDFKLPLLQAVSGDIDIKDAIINTDPLLENNSQTTTLNMMTNICTKNNFLLQPIPGGVTDDIDNILKPQKSNNDSLGGNSLAIVWAPTPENRISKNSDEPIYPEEGWIDVLKSMNKPIIVLEYGKPSNYVVKSIKAGTDDNKVTSESLQATNDIVNNTNPKKIKGYDCSMLAVMQGRSYKISADVMGNAQLYPTQFVAFDGIPIFKGLYWITEVVHKITPNNMETTFDAVKMKYGGKGSFAAVLPITTRSVRGWNSGGSFNSNSGIDALSSADDLNYEFLQQVKDIKIKNTDDINEVIKTYSKSKYADFPSWFNGELAGNKRPLCAATINAANFKSVWDFLIPIVWPNYGTSGCNFLEFVALHAIMYEETGGTYESKHEGMNDVKKAEHPGIAFAYDAFTLPATNGKAARDKSSYNKDPNKTAGELFNDPKYIETFKGLKFGNDPKVAKSNDPAWKGTNFPKSLFTNVEEAVTTNPTFISEADFYKYAGRGFIGSTWRSQYKKFVTFILNYSGSDPIVTKYRGIWKASPFDGDEETILTKATNANWDELFTSGAIQGFAIYTHADSAGKYQYMDPLTKPKDELIKLILKEAKKINVNDDYQKVHQKRVYVILNTLYPQSIPANNLVKIDIGPISVGTRTNVGTKNECTVVLRGNRKIEVHTGAEAQFNKREVRSITLHITDGWGYTGCAQGTVDHVGDCYAKFEDGTLNTRGGIHYAVDWTGTVVQGIPELIQSTHGNNWNAHGIGIEMCNQFGVVSKGPAGPQQKVVYSNRSICPIGKPSYGGTPNPGYVTLDFEYYGYNEFMEYTKAQMDATYTLCMQIFQRYPQIKAAIQGKNPYYVWGWTGKPAAGSSVEANKVDYKEYGIFGHAASRGATHKDPQPTPMLINMLRSLGMTG